MMLQLARAAEIEEQKLRVDFHHSLKNSKPRDAVIAIKWREAQIFFREDSLGAVALIARAIDSGRLRKTGDFLRKIANFDSVSRKRSRIKGRLRRQ